jgi:phosphohistidine phosphatase
MKTLTLLRHAKSSWDDPAARDFDRPLNRRGRKAARAMGKAMREQGIAFDQILASPAARVVEHSKTWLKAMAVDRAGLRPACLSGDRGDPC